VLPERSGGAVRTEEPETGKQRTGTAVAAKEQHGLLPGTVRVENPAAKGVTIFFKGGAAGKYELRVFDLNGDVVYEETKNNIQEGRFVWASGGVLPGIYLAYIRGPGLETTRRITITP
jgi:hypothetical protein